MIITSTFAILDVKKGRAALAKAVKAGKEFDVVIRGTLDCQHSRDDGTSIEFSLDVTEATLEEKK